MVKLSNYFPKIFIILIVFASLACGKKDVIYKREFTPAEQKELAESLLNGAGTDLYYQGTVAERMIIYEASLLDSLNGTVWREFGVPYLKRGFAVEANKYYEKAAKLDPKEWLGYKAYCWLYFYRDYETALKEFDQYDALTPDFVDYPQATSVDFMRGICCMKLNKYEEAIKYLEKHIEKETKDVGAQYVENLTYIMLGLANAELGDYEKANEYFDTGLKHNNSTADLWYYKGKNLMKMGKIEEAKIALENARKWLDQNSKNTRNYVEEFYAVYYEDLLK